MSFPDIKIFLAGSVGSEKVKFVEKTEDKIVGRGENAGYQHFLLFQQCFPIPLPEGC